MKALFTFLLLSSFSFAGLLNAIAFTVNGKAVTLYDIDRVAQRQSITKEEASVELVKELIAKELAELHNITIPKATVTAFIKDIMDKSNLDRKTFEQNLKIQNLTYDEYFNQVYMQKLQQALVGSITRGKISAPTKQEKLNFFNQHLNDFSLPENIELIEFTSPNRQSLVNIQRSPLFAPKDVKKVTKTVYLDKVNPKLAQLLLATKEKSYTKVIPLTINSMGMFYIKKIGPRKTAKFETVEERLTQILSNEKRQTFINNFFQDQMRKAQINYIKIEPLNL